MSVGKIQNGYNGYPVQAVPGKIGPAGKTTADAVDSRPEENRDVVDFSTQREEKQREEMLKRLEEMVENRKRFEVKKSAPKDKSATLTRRLVAASVEMEVRTIMIEAGQALMELQSAVVNCEKEDRAKIEAMISRIKKVLDRGSGKIKDLGEEQQLQARQAKAKRAKKEARAEELKEELRSRQAKRAAREQRYLLEAANQQLGDTLQQVQQNACHIKLDAASEAKIAAMAEAMAAAEVAAGSGEGTAAGSGAAAPGGEAAATVMEAGGSAEAGAVAGIDIAVAAE